MYKRQWLGLPVVGTTIVWLTGSIYLWTTTAALIFISLLFRIKLKILNDEEIVLSHLKTILLVFFAVLIGTSGLQFVFTITVILMLWSLELLRLNKFHRIPFKVWLVLVSFVIGIIIFLSSPGNFLRFEYATELAFFSNLIRFIMFMLGAYFGAGVGSLGSTLWLGLLVILLMHPLKENFAKRLDPFIWFIASLLSFLPLPNIHFGPKIGLVTINEAIMQSEEIVQDLNDFAQRDDIDAILILDLQQLLIFLSNQLFYQVNFV